jgi:hypothetical protein
MKYFVFSGTNLTEKKDVYELHTFTDASNDPDASKLSCG